MTIKEECIACLGEGEVRTWEEGEMAINPCGRCGGTGDEALARVKMGGDMWTPQ